jgi:putative transposase
MPKEQASGQRMIDVCSKHGISEATFYKYRAKYGGVDKTGRLRPD